MDGQNLFVLFGIRITEVLSIEKNKTLYGPNFVEIIIRINEVLLYSIRYSDNAGDIES